MSTESRTPTFPPVAMFRYARAVATILGLIAFLLESSDASSGHRKSKTVDKLRRYAQELQSLAETSNAAQFTAKRILAGLDVAQNSSEQFLRSLSNSHSKYSKFAKLWSSLVHWGRETAPGTRSTTYLANEISSFLDAVQSTRGRLMADWRPIVEKPHGVHVLNRKRTSSPSAPMDSPEHSER